MGIERVVDASVLLAWLLAEPGSEGVVELLGAAALSAVNLAEVLTRVAGRGAPLPDVRRQIAELGLAVADFDEDAAMLTADLRGPTRHRGLSLGDRACLALAKRENVPALTADRAWAGLDLGVEIVLIR